MYPIKTREKGYYWVVIKYKARPQIAEWDGRNWWITGSSIELDDGDFYNINETRVCPL